MLDFNRLLFLGRVHRFEVEKVVFYAGDASSLGLDPSNLDSSVSFRDGQSVLIFNVNQVNVDDSGVITKVIYENEADGTHLIVRNDYSLIKLSKEAA